MIMAGEVPLLDFVTPIFCLTQVSTDRPFFYRGQTVGRKGQILDWIKSQRTRTRFSLRFFVYDKKSVCVHLALGRTHTTRFLA